MAQGLIQRSLAGGEISNSLGARADQVKYQTGLATCRNFLIMRHGGITNRQGSGFIKEVKTSSLATYFIKFVFNDDQTYVIEIGNQYMRFYRNGARIAVSSVAAYNGATAYVPGNLVSSAGVNYYCIANTTGNAPPNATYWYALTGGIYEIPTPYLTADLPTIQFVQSGDVVTLTHPSYEQRELSRTGHTTWVLSTISFSPSIAAPGAPTVNAGAGAINIRYVVTSVKSDSYEESIASAVGNDATGAVAASGNVHTISWGAVSGAAEYNVYIEYPLDSGTYCFLGTATGTSFTNDGSITPDINTTPPVARNPFSSSNNYPSTSSYYQQRRVFANTNNATEKLWTTRTGMFKNLTISSPLQDDDAVTFTIAGRKVQEVRHLAEIGELVILTSGGEWVVLGDQDGVLRATQPPNLKQIGHNGAAEVMPCIVSDSLIYVQARGSIVRDLKYAVTSGGGTTGYQGKDLTIYAPHLFKKKTITRMDFAQIPHSVVWAVRSDGVLLGLTYLREHELWGWHRHDTDGEYEDVCVVPEGDEDIVYAVVKRTINGTTKRYVERFPSREIEDMTTEALFLDSYVTYDGRNTGATTVMLSTAAGWTVDDEITVTAALGTPFVAGDVGNDIVVWTIDNEGDVDEVRYEVSIRVDSFTSTTVVKGYPNKTVPSLLRSTAYTTWGRAVDEVSGASHLEAKDVAIFADGNVVANPNNPDYEIKTVTAGVVTLDQPYMVIHVGLPFVSDIETLDLDMEGQQIRPSVKNVHTIGMIVENTRGMWAGERFPENIPLTERVDIADLTEGLDEKRPEIDAEGNVELETGTIEMGIGATWRQSGRFVARQVDPLPATILGIIPIGEIGG